MKGDNRSLWIAVIAAILFAIIAATTCFVGGAELALQGEAREHHFVRVLSDESGRWVVLGPNAISFRGAFRVESVVAGEMALNFRETIELQEGRECVFCGPVGLYAVIQWPAADAQPAFLAVQIGDSPDPPPPPDPPDPPPGPTPAVEWKVSGLHVVIVDDENERGKLPQSQVNIFTSKPLREWLDQHTVKAPDGRPAYRFSGVESLESGGDARRLELPVFVSGWLLVQQRVAEGKVKLPAWIIGTEKATTIEELPASVDDALKRLEELK